MKIIRVTVGAAICGVVAVVLGCANPLGGFSATNGKGDIVTDSDETEFRRRARIRLELASGYFEQGQTNVALDEIKQALTADPGFADAYNLRGLIYMRLSNFALSEDSFKRALNLNPRDASVAHNYGWLMCQQSRYPEALQFFKQALSNPTYGGQAKTLMTQGVCQLRAGQRTDAELSLTRSYELDSGNPLTGYNLANVLFARGELTRSQFYIRRLNSGDLANAETLWLGAKIELGLKNNAAVQQLGSQLKKRFPESREAAAFDKGSFNE